MATIIVLSMYRYGGLCNGLSVQVFWLWCGNAVYHSILLFWMTVVALEQGTSAAMLPDFFSA